MTITYNIITVPGSMGVDATGINDEGTIVGGYSMGNPNNPTVYGFIEQNGYVITLNHGSYTLASDINDLGEVVGTYKDGGSPQAGAPSHGFTYIDGVYSTIDVPINGAKTSVTGINPNETGNNPVDIVGFYEKSGVTHGFLDVGGKFTYIDATSLGAKDTWIEGINDSGDMVGYYDDANGVQHGFIDKGGHFSSIDQPGAVSTRAYHINNLEQIVGSYVDANGVTHGYLEKDNIFTTIDPPGSKHAEANGINNLGTVVGIDASHPHGVGFLATFV